MERCQIRSEPIKISKSLADLHQGKMIIENKVGYGTTITIIFPFAEQQFKKPAKNAGTTG